jgi:periplasmic protein TonB
MDCGVSQSLAMNNSCNKDALVQASYQFGDKPQPYRGIAAVVVIHIFLAWLLISGTARKGLDLLTQPLQAVVIQEVTLPPPVHKVVTPPAPKVAHVPPPPFIPEPVVTPPLAAPAMAIEATTVVNRAPEPQAPVVPVAAAAVPAPSVRVDMAVACPVQVAPEMPRRAITEKVQGVVRAQVRIENGVVKDVTLLSGPKVFYPVVRDAMLQYKCTKEATEVIATQEFNFRLQ